MGIYNIGDNIELPKTYSLKNHNPGFNLKCASLIVTINSIQWYSMVKIRVNVFAVYYTFVPLPKPKRYLDRNDKNVSFKIELAPSF